MPRKATQLRRRADGGWDARKSIPKDVRREIGVGWEARFIVGPMSELAARVQHRDWLNDWDTRIDNVRANRKGEGQTLSDRAARALAVDWYRWLKKHKQPLATPSNLNYLEDLLSDWGDQLRSAIGKHEGIPAAGWHEIGNPDHDVRASQPGDLDRIYDSEYSPALADVLPVVADRAETATFLHQQKVVLDEPSKMSWLRWVAHDYAEALVWLCDVARGAAPATVDKYEKELPDPIEVRSEGVTPWQLFERYAALGTQADSTIARWRSVFQKLNRDFSTLAVITPEVAQEWINSLPNDDRERGTVHDVWLGACKAVFTYAKDERLIKENPFSGWRFRTGKKARNRPKHFTIDEIRTILKASLGVPTLPGEPHRFKYKNYACRRWAPWLMAYSGARGTEITQLRKSDIVTIEGIAAFRIMPDAGTVKTKEAREVPLHEHLIEQGFLEFVRLSGDGPLFHNKPGEKRPINPKPRDKTNPGKSLAVKAREQLGVWVRDDVGVKDEDIRPNHAWRHAFKLLGGRAKIDERLLEAICGWTSAEAKRKYGVPELVDLAEAMKLFSRYKVDF
jgi:integrase